MELTGKNRSTELDADIQARSDCVSYYGDSKWFAGHRNGATGLSNPDTEDINSESDFRRHYGSDESTKTDDVHLDYKSAVYWIQEQIDSDSAHESDDIRFWVDVVAI